MHDNSVAPQEDKKIIHYTHLLTCTPDPFSQMAWMQEILRIGHCHPWDTTGSIPTDLVNVIFT